MYKYRIYQKLQDNTNIFVQNGAIMYKELCTITGDKQAIWQLYILCYDRDNKIIYIDNNHDLQDENINKCEILTKYLTVNGNTQKQQPPIIIKTGKNIGKKNQTSVLQQALIDADSKFNFAQSKKEQDNCINPMLLNLYSYIRINNNSIQYNCKKDQLQFPIYVQRKYDGLRCIYVNKIPYTRSKKQFPDLQILQQQMNILFDTIPRQYQIIFDGELYIHNTSLQKLNSIIRCGNSDKNNLIYNIFDIDILQNNKQCAYQYQYRFIILQTLQQIISQYKLFNIVIVDTFYVTQQQQLDQLLISFIKQKYEGAVIRQLSGTYQYSINGCRSDSVVKCKVRQTIDVFICGYDQGQGKDTGCVIWKCQIGQNILNVVQNNTIVLRKAQFEFLQKYPDIIELLQKIPFEIEYSNMSDDGIPCQPRGVIFRSDINDCLTETLRNQLIEIGLLY